MNKTISINISGLVFYIEEGAFDILKAYLDSIKAYFATQKGGDDIVADIEARVAELFQERVSDEKTAITLEDVNEVITSLGQPQDMMDEEDAEENIDSERVRDQAKEDVGERQLFRDPDNKLLGGVCGGISAYFGIDPVWLRLAFVLSLVIYGTGVLLYIILWVVLPEAVSTSDRLKMRGKPINVDNIEKSILKGAKDLEEGLSDLINDPSHKARIKRTADTAQSGFQKIVDAIVQLVVLIVKFVARFAAVIAAIAGILIVAAVGMLLMTGVVFNDYSSLVMPQGLHGTLLIIALALIVLIPVLLLLIRIFQMGLKQGQMSKSIWVTGLIVWVLCIGTALVGSFGVMINFTNNASIENEVPLQQPDADRLYIKSVNSSKTVSRHHNRRGAFVFSSDDMYFEDGAFYYQNVNFRTRLSGDSLFHLVLQHRSEGRDHSDAIRNAELVKYDVLSEDSVITLSSFLSIEGGPWRGQEVNVILEIPVGKEIEFENYLYDIDNYSTMYREVGHDYAHKVFTMTSSGLKYSPVGTEVPAYEGMTSYDFGEFDRVDVQSEREIKVEVVEGNQFKVLVNSEIDGKRGFRVYKDRRTLKVSLTDLWTSSLPEVPMHVKIECPNLYSVNCAGQPECLVRADKTGFLEIGAFGMSKAVFAGNLDDFDLEVAGLAQINLSGTAKRADLDIAGSATVEALEFYVDRMDIDLAGSCDAEVHVTDFLNASLSGASDLKYKGTPQIRQDVSGVSSVKSIN